MSNAINESYTIRQSLPSDIPIILANHRTQYVDQNGWNEDFMSIVNDILSGWTQSHDPAIERFWIAEHATTAEFLGCVMLINKPPSLPTISEKPAVVEHENSVSGSEVKLEEKTKDKTARLRVLFVSPTARGMGLGRALVRLTTEFAREVGYKTVQLSTSASQEAAMRIYDQEGFVEISREENEKFGTMQKHMVLELVL